MKLGSYSCISAFILKVSGLLPVQQVLSKLFKKKTAEPRIISTFLYSELQLLPKVSGDGSMCKEQKCAD